MGGSGSSWYERSAWLARGNSELGPERGIDVESSQNWRETATDGSARKAVDGA